MQQAGKHSDISPERALGCFDMFILHEHFGDLDEVGYSAATDKFDHANTLIRYLKHLMD